MTATKRVKGVRAVADEIDVRYPDDKKTADDEIAKRIVDILAWDVEVPINAVQAVVRDGWVTLTGTVEWQFQRKAAEDDVRKLSGVRGISNGIEIKPSVQSADVKKKIEEALKRYVEAEAKRIGVIDRRRGQSRARRQGQQLVRTHRRRGRCVVGARRQERSGSPHVLLGCKMALQGEPHRAR